MPPFSRISQTISLVDPVPDLPDHRFPDDGVEARGGLRRRAAADGRFRGTLLGPLEEILDFVLGLQLLQLLAFGELLQKALLVEQMTERDPGDVGMLADRDR